ncbi:MAG: hypothetical protein QNJ47_21445 [Nostocaceae cyanobacterium]|nr:hypothetical protein [Nostocaceae cyanobacterium]
MPDPSSGRYQSKLFNFVKQQSRRLGEGLGRSLRQLQLATHWSLEALLQSVVLMMQKAVESAGKQLQTGEHKPKLHLQGETNTDDRDRDYADNTDSDRDVSQKFSSDNKKALTLIDAAVAKLESNIVPISRVSKEIVGGIQTQLNIFFYGKQQPDNNKSKVVETSPPQIPSKISTVLNFLFGNNITQETSLSISKIPGKKLPVAPQNPQVSNQNVADPWLTLDDLFDNSQEVVEVTDNQNLISPSSTANPPLPPSKSPEYIPQNLVNYYQKFLRQPQPGSGLVQKQKQTRDITPTQKTRTVSSISPLKTENHQGEISPQQRQNNQVEAKPDWIETKANIVGYEKHPLVQILEWLDIIILWIEEILVKFFAFLQRLLRGK